MYVRKRKRSVSPKENAPYFYKTLYLCASVFQEKKKGKPPPLSKKLRISIKLCISVPLCFKKRKGTATTTLEKAPYL